MQKNCFPSMLVGCLLALLLVSVGHAQISTEPVWSPEGQKIAFARGVWPKFDVFTVKPDGTKLQRLTDSDSTDYYPAWSPDGTRLAFVSLRDSIHAIYVMALDSSENAVRSSPIRLTHNDDSVPSWSPDGRKIVFTSKRDGNKEIYLMNADGSEPKRLTNNPGNDDSPQWSPDGEKIVFVSERNGFHDEIYLMNPDGSDPKRLTFDASAIETGRRQAKYARRPCWSPDGQKIAFGSNRDGNDEIYVMNCDGSNVTRLTHTPATEYYCTWSPDGQKIAFSSNRDKEHSFQLFIMSADGTNPIRITASENINSRNSK